MIATGRERVCQKALWTYSEKKILEVFYGSAYELEACMA